MILLIAVYIAALATIVLGIGWPWGIVAAVGCLLIPLAAMRILMRFTGIYRGDGRG